MALLTIPLCGTTAWPVTETVAVSVVLMCETTKHIVDSVPVMSCLATFGYRQ